ncbi:MAG: hypothetical protein JW806_06370 [Sedimentisphaerales bacterium]|nr:hypothetical protein [Sedimentisphaerales bacterium]
MKSERRHELATNELADWVVNFPEWFKENMTTVIAAAIIVVGLIAYTIFFYSRQNRFESQKDAIATETIELLDVHRESILRRDMQGTDVSESLVDIADRLGQVAIDAENPSLSALAMIKRAEALRSKLHYQTEVANPDVQKQLLDNTRQMYAAALGKAQGQPVIAAMAEYGMALCLEDMGNFAGAEALYNKIISTTEYEGSSFIKRAKLRLKTIEDNKGKVLFVQAASEPQVNITPPRSLSLEAPVTIDDMAGQKDLDFNSTQ